MKFLEIEIKLKNKTLKGVCSANCKFNSYLRKRTIIKRVFESDPCFRDKKHAEMQEEYEFGNTRTLSHEFLMPGVLSKKQEKANELKGKNLVDCIKEFEKTWRGNGELSGGIITFMNIK